MPPPEMLLRLGLSEDIEFRLRWNYAWVFNYVAWAQSVALGIPLSERSELYLEYFGIFSEGMPGEFTLGFVNAGVDFLITNDFVFDIRVGRGLTEDSDDFFAGIGGGYRYQPNSRPNSTTGNILVKSPHERQVGRFGFRSNRSSPPDVETSRGQSGSIVGTTRRLLNFFWPASGDGKPGCGGGWMRANQR